MLTSLNRHESSNCLLRSRIKILKVEHGKMTSQTKQKICYLSYSTLLPYCERCETCNCPTLGYRLGILVKRQWQLHGVMMGQQLWNNEILPHALNKGIPKIVKKCSLSFLDSLMFSFHPLPTPIIYPILLLPRLTRSLPKKELTKRNLHDQPAKTIGYAPWTAYCLPYLHVILNPGRHTGTSATAAHIDCTDFHTHVCFNQLMCNTVHARCLWPKDSLAHHVWPLRCYILHGVYDMYNKRSK